MSESKNFTNLGWLRMIFFVIVFGALLGMSILGPPPTGAARGGAVPSLHSTADGRVLGLPSGEWNTFLGGGGIDTSSAIAFASNGDLFVTGSSSASWGNPIRAYSKKGDAFVARVASGGVLKWITFLGGNGDDAGHSMTVDASDNVYVTGSSDANWGNPIVPYHVGWSDAYLAKVNSNGALQWNTFFGASGDGDWASGVTVDSNGNVYVIGTSSESWGNPKRGYSESYDAFVVKINPSGELKWNTFLGGELGDLSAHIRVDGSGNIYVSGESAYTWGAPLRAYTGDADIFTAKLNSNGVLQWNTFLGGPSGDYPGRLAADDYGNLYVTGMVNSPYGKIYDAYLAKLNSDGGLKWETYPGSGDWDGGADIALEGNKVYLVGWSRASWGIPIRPYTNGQDTFVAELNSDGMLKWNLFLGGSGGDTGSGIIRDVRGNLYVTGSSDATWGTPKRAYTSNTDVFVVKLVIETTPPSVKLTKTGVDASGRKFIEMTVQDEDSGISKIEVLKSTNANTVIPPFTPGTIDPIKIISTKINQAKASVVSVRIIDMAGNMTVGDPVLQLLTIEKGKRIRQTIGNIPVQEHFINVANGAPGLKRLRIEVNDKMFEVVTLATGASRTIDIAPAMNAEANKIKLVGLGQPGDSAFIIIGDRAMDASAVMEGFVQGQKEHPQENFGWGTLGQAE